MARQQTAKAVAPIAASGDDYGLGNRDPNQPEWPPQMTVIIEVETAARPHDIVVDSNHTEMA